MGQRQHIKEKNKISFNVCERGSALARERERVGQPFFSLMRVTSVESGIAVSGLTFPFSERQRNAWNTKKLRGVGLEGVVAVVEVWVCERDMWQQRSVC